MRSRNSSRASAGLLGSIGARRTITALAVSSRSKITWRHQFKAGIFCLRPHQAKEAQVQWRAILCGDLKRETSAIVLQRVDLIAIRALVAAGGAHQRHRVCSGDLLLILGRVAEQMRQSPFHLSLRFLDDRAQTLVLFQRTCPSKPSAVSSDQSIGKARVNRQICPDKVSPLDGYEEKERVIPDHLPPSYRHQIGGSSRLLPSRSDS